MLVVVSHPSRVNIQLSLCALSCCLKQSTTGFGHLFLPFNIAQAMDRIVAKIKRKKAEKGEEPVGCDSVPNAWHSPCLPAVPLLTS